MECKVIGVTQTQDRQQVFYHASDDRASFALLSPVAVAADYNPAQTELVEYHKVDYDVCGPDVDAAPFGVPSSYLQIKTVEEGADWFSRHTKYPDMVCEMLARYEFGELKETTTKEFRNIKKRTTKKKAKCPPCLQVKTGKFLVNFD
jgi:hypothetical protein